MTIRPAAAVTLLLTLLIPGTALAATAQRTFVASNGSDVHPCSLPQPCRSFAAAIAKTSSDGEVIVLDSAGYGPVSITKSVSITAPAGIYAGVTVTSGDGIAVDAPGIVVGLRGLSINGLDIMFANVYAIHFLHGARLWVEDCEITKLGTGILLEAANSGVSMRNVRIHDSLDRGILVAITTGAIQVSIVDSEIANQPTGVEVSAFPATLEQVTIAHSALTRNDTALDVESFATGNASVLSDGNTITYSTIVFKVDSLGVAAIFTPGNNTVGYYGTLIQGGTLSPCCGV